MEPCYTVEPIVEAGGRGMQPHWLVCLFLAVAVLCLFVCRCRSVVVVVIQDVVVIRDVLVVGSSDQFHVIV